MNKKAMNLNKINMTSTEFGGRLEYVFTAYSSKGAVNTFRVDVNLGYGSSSATETAYTDGGGRRYAYGASGQKLRVAHYVAKPNITRTFGVKPGGSTQDEVLFAGQTDYLLGGSLVVKDGSIDKVLFDGGYAKATRLGSTTYGFSPYYYNKDHLGNIREVVNMGGTVQQVTNYYPFGAPYADPNAVMGATVQPYKYNGKELDRMHGLNTYDYGARQYNPVTARWDRMDSLSEKYYSISPYAYCMGNPIKYVDLEGKKVYLFSTSLPNAHWLPWATHTFLVVQDSKGKITYAAYGPQNGHPISGMDRLAKCPYTSDEEAYLNYLNKHELSSYVKGIDLIPVPEGMTSDDFDNKVVEVINEFGNNPNIKYNLNPTEEDEGNCNSSTSTILLKAGIKEEELEKIKSSLKGIHWGFSTTPKPWTSEEQKNAVEKEKKKAIERNKRLDALQMAL